MKKNIAFHTLGCKLNYSETSAIARLFDEKEYNKVDFNAKADIYVINTCSVTENAEKKSRQAIRRAIKISPQAFIVVTGCYCQLKPEEVANISGVDIVLGTNEKFNILNYIDNFEKKEVPQVYSCNIEDTGQFIPSYSLGDRTRAFLKVQDGCDYMCSYCIVPMARGRSRNESISKLVKQAEIIAHNGIKEIVLTGANIGDYGKSNPENKENFYELLKELAQVERIERFRISSIEPDLLTDEIIEFVAKSGKFVPHFHIPLQSGSNKILKLMKRRYKRELFADRVKKIKSLIPSACIGVDVIVGFPGETENDFMDTYNFIKKLALSYLHVFTYSERENTKALKIKEKVPHNERNRRSKILHNLSAKKRRYFYQQNIQNNAFVLFEDMKQNGNMNGFTENYIRVETPYNKNFVNKIVQVRLKEINEKGNVMIETCNDKKAKAKAKNNN